ncbi:Rpn family recombination-promoting nuclease/putative transposase [Kovacikia minuta]|uniref:Rpn family recombination-promoting nuclease/putative transposase n=1 Tax=Kovacikia minuta TaxID=2931930 RepID=UPI0020C75176|nr:Rpn family recombination-promoting nuclease/putative transposase [Kovacikia minuta]
MAIMIFTKRSLDRRLPNHFQDYADSPRLKRVYLDELPADLADQSLELSVLQLIGVKDDVAPERARQLIERARSEVTDAAEQNRQRRIGINHTGLQVPHPRAGGHQADVRNRRTQADPVLSGS